jgi:hypothetical protein
MNAAVERAVAELKVTFDPCAVVVEDDAEGGAYVIVESVPLAGPYEQKDTWFGFHITGQFPYSDIYPVFARADLRRRDGTAFGEAISTGHTFRTRAAIQVSRKSNGRDPLTEAASAKILKVRAFLESRP